MISHCEPTQIHRFIAANTVHFRGNQIMRVLYMLLIVSLISSGCASVSSVLSSKKEGTVKTYPVTVDQAWQISRAALR